ncbi:MAG: hypothetical protein CK427_00290 [Leptospira sp.]|nr:MAG: hypothetical protein CK427_00290 [Leptospira sp.]
MNLYIIIMKYFIVLIIISLILLNCYGKSKTETINIPVDFKERCSMLPDGGPCRALILGFYYDAESNTCLDFNYGGCKGSLPFRAKSDCMQHCVF